MKVRGEGEWWKARARVRVRVWVRAVWWSVRSRARWGSGQVAAEGLGGFSRSSPGFGLAFGSGSGLFLGLACRRSSRRCGRVKRIAREASTSPDSSPIASAPRQPSMHTSAPLLAARSFASRPSCAPSLRSVQPASRCAYPRAPIAPSSSAGLDGAVLTAPEGAAATHLPALPSTKCGSCCGAAALASRGAAGGTGGGGGMSMAGGDAAAATWPSAPAVLRSRHARVSSYEKWRRYALTSSSTCH